MTSSPLSQLLVRAKLSVAMETDAHTHTIRFHTHTVRFVSVACCSSKSNSCNLSELEVLVEPFHYQILSSLSPACLSLAHNKLPSPSHSRAEPITLLYITTSQLQSLLDASEHDLNSKSGSDKLVVSRLGFELGPLIEQTQSMHSDLIPGVYEGGMKIWECAYDLVDYLASNENSIPLRGSRILELGCGIGLPGIVSLLSGAKSVCFHDYNREVLSCLTIPSVLANLISGQPDLKSGLTSQTSIQNQLASKVRFYCGDWAEFTSHGRLEEPPYDIILTSETIYSATSQPKLLQALKKLTNQSTGLVVMAAKAHYFGVGGSVAMFRDLVDSDGHFEVTAARTIPASVSRVILILRPKNKH